MNKLKFYGIVGKAHALIKSYLSDRYQRVLINDKFSEWGKITRGVPQGSILGPMLFVLYINDLPKVVNGNSKPVLFADDTSIIVSDPNLVNYKNDLISSFRQLNEWFDINFLSLNYNKTQYVHFRTFNSETIHLDISYNNRCISNDINTRFLGITVDSSLSWKYHIDELMVKLSKACYAIRSLRPLVSTETLRMIYYSYFHAVMSFGMIFGGNSPHSNNIFKIQKVIRIITNSRSRDSCKELLKELQILPFYSQYIFSLLVFVINNISLFKINSELYDINTRAKNNFYLSQPRLSIYMNGVILSQVRWVPCQHGMARPQVADGGNGL
jgi:hypothetical protein